MNNVIRINLLSAKNFWQKQFLGKKFLISKAIIQRTLNTKVHRQMLTPLGRKLAELNVQLSPLLMM